LVNPEEIIDRKLVSKGFLVNFLILFLNFEVDLANNIKLNVNFERVLEVSKENALFAVFRSKFLVLVVYVTGHFGGHRFNINNIVGGKRTGNFFQFLGHQRFYFVHI